MKKLRFLAALAIVYLFSLSVVVPKVLAANVTIRVSPASRTVTVGESFSAQIRINAGSDSVNAVDARLNFDNTKVRLDSVSGGDLNTYISEQGASSYHVVAGVISPVTGDRLIATANFTALTAGSTSLTFGTVEIANDGVGHTVTKNSGTVTINNPSGSGPGGNSGGSSGGGSGSGSSGGSQQSPKPTAPADPSDKQAPGLHGEPVIDKDKKGIKFKLTANEPVTAVLYYSKEGSEKKQLNSATLGAEHSFDIGKDAPLDPGTTYTLELAMTDANGNAAAPLTYTVRTMGVSFKIRLIDALGKVLAKIKVVLHSDPIEGMTDENGVVTFEDVVPGEHTLIYEVDGVTVQQPVTVGAELADVDIATAAAQELKLPFQLATATTTTKASRTAATWVVLVALGFAAGLVISRLPYGLIRKRLVGLVRPGNHNNEGPGV